MPKSRRPRAKFNVRLMIEDAAELGWNQTDLARVTSRDKGTISRFISGEVQTPKVAKELAYAMGRQVSRYLIRRTATSPKEEQVA